MTQPIRFIATAVRGCATTATAFLRPGVDNETSHEYEGYASDKIEVEYIQGLVGEIVANCNIHWQKYFSWRCNLEGGASPDRVQNLDQLLYAKLPRDYKLFLQLTDGLDYVLDGGAPHLTFTPLDSIDWLRGTHQTPSKEQQELWATWVIESMFGPGTRKELTEQVQQPWLPQHDVHLIEIASRTVGSGGVFLVRPEDCRSVAQDWVRPAFEDGGRCGSLIGRIDGHGDDYFGDMGRQLYTLRDREEWAVLQVDHRDQDPMRKTRCRLYPSFTAFLQALVEITQSRSDDLLTGDVPEFQHKECCRSRWEWEWARNQSRSS